MVIHFLEVLQFYTYGFDRDSPNPLEQLYTARLSPC